MLIDPDFDPPEHIDDLTEAELFAAPWKTEYDVYAHLFNMGHEVIRIGVHDSLSPLREAINTFKPHITFNMLEGFRGLHTLDQHVVSYLELLNQPYTGCNPRGLTLARDKALTKMIMAYHRIKVPQFAVFPRGKRVARPKRLPFPLLVKSGNAEGSVGIAQASLVWDDQKLTERVQYIHDALSTIAIAEQYIEGRELYVGVLGNQRLTTFPAWELHFDNAPQDYPLINSEKAKWDSAYQKRLGISTRQAVDLPDQVQASLPKLCKRIYQNLGLTGYARLDFRLHPSGDLYLLEANPNPQLGYGEDFAESAECIGLEYEALLAQILKLGLSYTPESLS